MTLAVADRWFESRRLDDGVTLIWEPHVDPGVRCNIWHVRGSERDLLLDSGLGLASLRQEIALVGERPLLAVASHSHFDHVGGHYEFAERAIHPAEADILAHPTRANTLAENYMAAAAFAARPAGGLDLRAYNVRPAPATLFIDEGDVIDLGDRRLEVMHLPGHSPGSIALWERESGILFAGDVVYDGGLIDDLYHSDVARYVASMERLRDVPARVVHAGHFASFGRERLLELIDDYLAGRRVPGCPANANQPP